MLVSLHVKNLALIDETEVFFGEGLNILSGETGAGKSIIIGSVNLALGAKADKELIRLGAEYALVELIFQIEEESLKKHVLDLELPVEEDNLLIIQRRIQPARSVCKVNGETVTAKQVKELAELLIDIHGQHEHQSLLSKKKHLEILDEYSGEKIYKIKETLKNNYKKYEALKKELEESSMEEETRKREIALAEFEVNEIEEAALKADEDEVLERDYRKMANGQKITEALSVVYGCCSEEEQGAASQIERALREIRTAVGYDEELEPLQAMLSDIDSMLSDLNYSLTKQMDGMEFNEFTFRQTEERLNLVNHLKSKYGKTMHDVIAYGETVREKLEKLSDYENYRNMLAQQVQNAREQVLEDCKKVSKVRSQNAKVLAGQMKEALVDLNFLDVRFEIQVRSDEESIHAGGYDEVEFMISTNPGETIKPLAAVASGGELSRIMLALKTVLAKKDKTGTLIFDEIDAGISGKTAWKVSEKLGILGKSHQVICITHLPQIAAMADNHFLIEKMSDKEKTTTTIKEVKEEDSIRELARLLGSENITETALSNAKELKEMAAKTKQS